MIPSHLGWSLKLPLGGGRNYLSLKLKWMLSSKDFAATIDRCPNTLNQLLLAGLCELPPYQSNAQPVHLLLKPIHCMSPVLSTKESQDVYSSAAPLEPLTAQRSGARVCNDAISIAVNPSLSLTSNSNDDLT